MIDVYKQLIDRGLTTRQIGKELNISPTTVRYWLKKFGLKTKYVTRGSGAPRNILCKVCGIELKDNKKNLSKCGSCLTKIRRFLTKQKAIRYLGGKCNRCGFNGHPAALEFHHLFDKKFTIGSAANKSWEIIVKELDKCELICSNCHRIEHSVRGNEFITIAARNYNGKFIKGEEWDQMNLQGQHE